MRKHTLEIADKKGQAFRLHISTPSAGDRLWTAYTDGISKRPEGHWRTIDKGFIRYHNGKAIRIKSISQDLTTRDLYLVSSDSRWGVQIFEYEDWIGVNETGMGTVLQPWVLSIAVGKFSWVLVD